MKEDEMYSIDRKRKYIEVKAPYNKHFVEQAKEYNGIFERKTKVWKFLKEDELKIIEILNSIFDNLEFVRYKVPYNEHFNNIAKKYDGKFEKEAKEWIFDKTYELIIDNELIKIFGWNFKGETEDVVIGTDKELILNNECSLEIAGIRIFYRSKYGKVYTGDNVKSYNGIFIIREIEKDNNKYEVGKFKILNFPKNFPLPDSWEYYEDLYGNDYKTRDKLKILEIKKEACVIFKSSGMEEKSFEKEFKKWFIKNRTKEITLENWKLHVNKIYGIKKALESLFN